MTNPCFPLRRAFLLLFMLSQFSFSLSIYSKRTCKTNPGCSWFYYIFMLNHDSLCWLYPWDKHFESWSNTENLHLPLCWLQTLLTRKYYLETYLLCQSLYFHVSKVQFMKGFYLDNSIWLLIVCFTSTIDNCFGSLYFTSWALHYYLDQDYVGSMSHKKIFSLWLTYSRTSRS